MPSLYTHQDSNIRKTWILMLLFLLVVVGIGWGFSLVYKQPLMIVVAIVFALIMNIISYWKSDKIALSVSGAKSASKNKYRKLYRLVENLSITAGLPKPKVYIIRDRVPNAFATGRNAEHAAIAVTTGLLEILDTQELEGVISHELSHIGNKDILVSTIVVVLVGFVTLLSDIFIRGTMFGGRGRDKNVGGILVVVGIVLIILSPVIASLIQLAVSRKREFLADASGALLTRYPEGLAKALEKIEKHSGKMIRANHATAHLFIASPFGSKKHDRQILNKLFSTHPPVEERIKALLGK